VLSDKRRYSPTHHLSWIAHEKRLNPGCYDPDPSAVAPMALDGFRTNRRRLENYRPRGTWDRASSHLPVWRTARVERRTESVPEDPGGTLSTMSAWRFLAMGDPLGTLNFNAYAPLPFLS
jgi:hypothetical protein